MNRFLISVLTALLVITGCGGGGNNGNNITPSALLPITSTNAVEVTQAAYEAALASASLGELSGETGLIGNAPGNVNKIGDAIGSANKVSGAPTRIPIPAQTEGCDVDGSVTISGEIADPITPTLSAGDFFVIEFDLCDDGIGDVTDGRIRIEVVDFTGDFLGGRYDMTMTMTLTFFQVATPEDTVTSHGSATVVLNTMNSPSVSVSVNGRAMTVDTNTSSESLIDFISAQTLDGSALPATFTMTASGTLDTTQLSGSVRYSTPVMFEGFDGEYPYIGEFLITGDNSTAKLTALDGVFVTIEIDADGDGEFEAMISTTWAELTAQ